MAAQETVTAEVPVKTQWFVGFYCLVLMTLYNLAVTGLIAVPLLFILNNELKLDATGSSVFGFCTDSPFFIGFAFGFLRDRWRPWGGDRGYFAVVPILLALVFVALAFSPHTYGILMAGLIAVSALSALLGAAAQGLLAAIAKDFGMTGRLSVITLITVRGAVVYSQIIGGWLGEHAGHRVPFLASAAVCLTVPLMAVWRPRRIFRSGNEVFVSVIPEGAMESIRRLLRHRAVYLPAIVLFLWEFAPGWGTPLNYFLKNTVHLGEAALGGAQGLRQIGVVVAALSYAVLCRHIRFKRLLFFGTFLGVLGGPIFLLIHTPMQANAVSFIAGISCGIALASYYDLLVRCCPKELEGAAFMLTFALFTFGADASDIFGSYLFDRGGFGLALAVSTAFTALIFVPLAFIPRSVAEPQEGDRIIDPDPPVADELAS